VFYDSSINENINKITYVKQKLNFLITRKWEFSISSYAETTAKFKVDNRHKYHHTETDEL